MLTDDVCCPLLPGGCSEEHTFVPALSDRPDARASPWQPGPVVRQRDPERAVKMAE